MKRWTPFVLIAVAFSILFWLLRERSHSGDWRNWIRYVEDGFWYRLREPVCLALYQLPLALFRPLGATAEGVSVGVSCVSGGLSMALAHSVLQRVTEQRLLRAVGFLALAASYGVTGVFFGHVEHYAVMSLGCLIYMYYAVRYLRGECGILGSALSLSLLLATHLMAAWLVPSLVLLPWLRANARSNEALAAGNDLRTALLAVALPNIAVWVTVIVAYYDGSVASLFQDVRNGAYSWEHYSVGNALGGGNESGFLAPSQVASWDHLRLTLILFLLYSPFVFLTLPVLVLRAPIAARAWLRDDRLARFFVSLFVPYLVYVLTWEADLGYERDWDLFSHITIFALFITVSLGGSALGRRFERTIAAIGLAASLTLTGFLVLETHRSETATGISRVLAILGGDVEAPKKQRGENRTPGGDRP